MSGIQHFCFCPRQWALIHIERQWSENWRTTAGELMHERVHDESVKESRSGKFVLRGLRVSSSTLQLAGVCDVVEFYSDEDGFEIPYHSGRWIVVPVEYKRGRERVDDADRCQLCAQALALEEMLSVSIGFGFIFHGETKRREKVDLGDGIRMRTQNLANEMISLFRKNETPSPSFEAHCRSCSLFDFCLPNGNRRRTDDYVAEMLQGEI